MSKYTTGEMARLCGVSVRTVQYYDTRGILVPSELSEGGRRLYSDADLNRMKIVCFLRDLDVPLGSIAKLMNSQNAEEVLELILSEQEARLREELRQKQEQLHRAEELHSCLSGTEKTTVESIADMVHVMKNQKHMRRMYAVMVATGIPVNLLQWVSILLWILRGIWWPFTVWLVVATVYGICVSNYYFRRVEYLCPSCHSLFRPRMKESFFAKHTPATRALTCPCCGYKGFCVETYRTELTKENRNAED